MPLSTPAKSPPSVRYILPSGTPSPSLELASSGASAREASKVLGIFRDDQALAAMPPRQFEEEIPVPRASLPHDFPHHLLITPSADSRHRSLTPSFSPIERNNSPVSTRQSNGIIPYPSRLLARLICAGLQALGDKLGRVEAWSRVAA